MNPEFPTDPRQALEVSLTALVLGELPPDQAEFLRRAMEQDRELARTYERLRQTIDLVRETEKTPVVQPAIGPEPMKLSEARRQKLLGHLKTLAPPEFAAAPRRRLVWMVPAGIAALLLIFIGGALLPALSRSKSRGISGERLLAWSADEKDAPSERRSRLLMRYRGDAGQASATVAPSEAAIASPESLAEIQEKVRVNETLTKEPKASIVLPQAGETKKVEQDRFYAGYAVQLQTPAVAGSAGIPAGGPESANRQQEAILAQKEFGAGAYRFGGVGGGGSVANSPVPAAVPDSVNGAHSLSFWSASGIEKPQAEARDKKSAAFGLAEVDTFRLEQNTTPPMASTKQILREPALRGVAPSAAKDAERQKSVVAATDSAGRVAGDAVSQTPTLGDSPAPARAFEKGPGSPGQRQMLTLDSLSVAKSKAGEVATGTVPPEQRPQIGVEFRSSKEDSAPLAGATIVTNSSSALFFDESRTLARNMDGSARGREPVEDFGRAAGRTQAGEGELLRQRLNELEKLGSIAKGERFSEPLLQREAKQVASAEVLTDDAPKRQVSERHSALQSLHEAELRDIDAPASKPAAPPLIPQPEIQTLDNPFSTFSLNISDVSYKMAAASLEKGVMPEPGSIRTEEFINAFDYHDPEPARGMPVGFCWDRARYPFAQNRDLLRFSIKTAAEGRQTGRSLNVVLLLDSSGSMERADRVRIIREALKVLAAQLQAHDKVSVITFARTAQLRVDGLPGNQAGPRLEEIGGLTPQGGTNLEEAMNLAYQTALKHYLSGGVNRVVLLTDGAANLGEVSAGNLKKKVEDHRKQGIAFDCFGIGWEGYNDDLLEELSRNGDGRYSFINTPEQAATEFAAQLAGALRPAASDVKVQVEFNPKRVTAWRQIGYAKHQLTKEQFRDNTVDAAEIAAAESGNALYAVETNPQGEGPLAIVRVRYKVPGTSDYREHEWAVPYAGGAPPLEQSSHSIRLAACAAAFSEWLASNPHAAEVTPDALLGYLRGVPEIYAIDPKPKQLEWMIRQAQSLAGK